jgi:hypothetical protein
MLLQEEYSKDPNVMVSGVNCDNHSVCARNNVTSFPTFIEHYKGEFANTTSENKSMETFQYLTDRLLEKKLGNPWQPLPSNPHDFPFFVFQVSRSTNYSTIHTLKRAIVTSGMFVNCYLNQSDGFPDTPIVFYFNSTHQTIFNQELSILTLKSFFVDTANTSALDLSIAGAKKSTQRIAFFIGIDSKSHMTMKRLSKKFPGKFLWATSANRKEASKYFHLQKTDLPAIVIVDPTNWTYSALKLSLDIQEMKRFLGNPSHVFMPIKSTEKSSLSLIFFVLISITAIVVIVAVLIYIVFGRRSSKRD